jgi:hypothetical protein
MTGNAEDKRAASSLATTLSGFVITAALAVLGAQAVVATFVIDRRDHLGSFYGVSAAAAAALVLSIIFGGLGIDEIIAAGAGGNWKHRTTGGKFNIQSILALVGAILVMASAFLGDTKKAPAKATKTATEMTVQSRIVAPAVNQMLISQRRTRGS